MSIMVNTRRLVDALKDEGFPMPDQCREARVVMGVDRAFMVQYDVFLTNEDLAKLGRALQSVAAAGKAKDVAL